MRPHLLVVAAVVATVNAAASIPLVRLMRWVFAGIITVKPGARGLAT